MTLSFADKAPLLPPLIKEALSLWDIDSNAHIELINFSENATFKINTAKNCYVLRVNRPDYHDKQTLKSEIAWIDALIADNSVTTAPIVMGKNGEKLQSLYDADDQQPYCMILFLWLQGEHLPEHINLSDNFYQLGIVTAKLHQHVQNWQIPESFKRLSWDFDTMIGETPHWGSWHHAPLMDKTSREILTQAVEQIKKNLGHYGKTEEKFGLIHADLRLANLLVHKNAIQVIDFDDCGFSWFLYDIGAAFSFIENHPQKNAMIQAWLKGYQEIKPLKKEDIAMIPTFIMLRRIQLLGWISSHHQTETAQKLKNDFTKISCLLAKEFCANNKALAAKN